MTESTFEFESTTSAASDTEGDDDATYYTVRSSSDRDHQSPTSSAGAMSARTVSTDESTGSGIDQKSTRKKSSHRSRKSSNGSSSTKSARKFANSKIVNEHQSSKTDLSIGLESISIDKSNIESLTSSPTHDDSSLISALSTFINENCPIHGVDLFRRHSDGDHLVKMVRLS